MMDPKVFLGEQRRRLTGAVMTHLEREIYPSITAEQQRTLRAKVLAAVGAYHDNCLDIIKSLSGDGEVRNEIAIELLRDLLAEARDGR